MMLPAFSERLKSQSPLFGVLVTSRDPSIAEALSLTGIDWLFIDTEHAPLAIADVQELVRATARRCATLVRLAGKSDETCVKQALDIGCDGIIVPNINSAEEAATIVRWAKFPPQGERSVGVARAHGYGLHFANYISNANKTTSIVIQIETKAAVKNIDEIAKVPGIDGLFIGPYDLSASMEHIGEVTHPDVVTAIKRVKDAAANHNLPTGIFVNTPEAAATQVKDGVKFIAIGIDLGFMIQSVRATLERISSL